MMFTKERAFASISALLSVAISLALCEAMLRIFPPTWLEQRMAKLNPSHYSAGFGSDLTWKFDRRGGQAFRFTPLSQFNVSHYEYHNIANIDEFGGRRVPVRLSSQIHLLPMLGDSFTFGVGVEDDETFVSRIATHLTTHRVLNLGFPGSALHHQLDIIKLRHNELGNPNRYLFFFFIGNDFSNILSADRRNRVFKRKMAPAENSRGLFSLLRAVNAKVYHSPLLKQIYILQFFRRYALNVVNSKRRLVGVDPAMDPIFILMDRSMQEYHVEAQKALSDQLTNLAILQKQLRFLGMIILIPDLHQLDSARRLAGAHGYGLPSEQIDPFRPNALARNSINEEGIAFFDASECLLNTGLGAQLYYQQDNHFRAIGHRELARCVGPHIMHFLHSDSDNAATTGHRRVGDVP